MFSAHGRASAVLVLSLFISSGASDVHHAGSTTLCTTSARKASLDVHLQLHGLHHHHQNDHSYLHRSDRGALISLRGGSAAREDDDDADDPVAFNNAASQPQAGRGSWLKELMNTPRPSDVYKGAFDVFADEIKQGNVIEEAWPSFLEGIQDACQDAIDTFRREYQVKPVREMEKRGVFFVVLEGPGQTVRNKVCEGLLAAGRNVTAVDFPPHTATTPTRRIIREIEMCDRPIDRKTRHSLRAACRWECAVAIRELLSNGVDLVAGNSYSFCDVARSVSPFQNLDLKWCKALEKGLPAPDCVIYVQGDKRYEREGNVEQLMDDTWITIPSAGLEAAEAAVPKAVEFCSQPRTSRRYLWADAPRAAPSMSPRAL